MAAAGETPLKPGSKILIIGSGPIVIGQACGAGQLESGDDYD